MTKQQEQTDLCITESEFRSRVEKVQEFVRANDLGGVLVYSGPRTHMWYQAGHVGWLSNWNNRDRIVDSIVLVPAEGKPALLFAGLPFMMAQVNEISWITDVRLVSSPDPNAIAIQDTPDMESSNQQRDFAGEAAAIIIERGFGKQAVGLIGIDNMPVPFYEALRKGFGGDRLRVVADIVAQLRRIKSPAEIELMRHAAHLSDLGYETFTRVAKPGMPGIEAVAEAERTVRAQGGEDVMYWIANTPDGRWSESIVDIKPTPRILNYGDQLLMCSYVVYKGYWAHCHRTGSLGKEANELKRNWEVCFEAQCAAVDKMQSGVPVSDVVRAARLTAEKKGYSLQGGRIGHGIGADYSEAPFLSEANHTPLEKGNMVIVHTLFSVPDKDTFFVAAGDLCHVTDDGPELLHKFSSRPFLTQG